MQKARDPFPIITGILFFVLLLGIVGTMDYEDAIAEADLYGQNVHAGVWPDYEGTYAKECRDCRYKADR